MSLAQAAKEEAAPYPSGYLTQTYLTRLLREGKPQARVLPNAACAQATLAFKLESLSLQDHLPQHVDIICLLRICFG